MEAELKKFLEGTGQEHILDRWEYLAEEQQKHLYEQCKALLKSPEHVKFLGEVLQTSLEMLAKGTPNNIQPPSESDVVHLKDEDDIANYYNEGEAMIKNKGVAVVILAGGSGTRLGTSFPKGMLVPPQLSLRASLFQMHCQRVLKAEQFFDAPGAILVAIMTSAQTHDATTKFFADNKYFGLQASQVHFFQQSSLPCFTPEGKIIMEDLGVIAQAPGGNGGVWSSLADSGVLSSMQSHGVQYAHIITVDNLLAPAIDPWFFGFAAKRSADVVVKTTPKASDAEAVGVFAQRDGKWGVVEYTEIGAVRAKEVHPKTKKRLYNAANIAMHLCSLEFLKTAADVMKTFQQYHAAKKVIPTCVMNDDTLGFALQPDGRKLGKCNGVKIEAFIFDVFQFAKNFKMVQVDRAEEFAPIKNADNDDPKVIAKDSPASAVRLLHSLHAKWIAESVWITNAHRAGDKMELSPNVRAEISPLVSMTKEGLHRTHDIKSKWQQFEDEADADKGKLVFVVDVDGVRIEQFKAHI